MEENEIKAYYDGVKEGVWKFAWMKDGTYYVGTTGKTLKEAITDVDNEMKKALGL